MAPLGNFLRLHPLHTNELPDHTVLNSRRTDLQHSQEATEPNNLVIRPSLRHFLTHILDEASIFAEETVPQFKKKGLRKSPPAAQEVELLTKTYSSSEIARIPWCDSKLPRPLSGNAVKPAEHWFARRSRHENQSVSGSATFSEMDSGLRQDHSKHEQDYTPDVYDHHEVMSWNGDIENLVKDNGEIQGDTGTFTDVQMEIREMCHKMPPPLANRVFPVLVITAAGSEKHSFLVVQVPVNITSLNAAFYSNGRNISESKHAIKAKKVVLGSYTSLERIQIMPDQSIEWLMATASDAKGWLPMWLQKLGVPGAVIKDVGLFMKWLIRERRATIQTQRLLTKDGASQFTV